MCGSPLIHPQEEDIKPAEPNQLRPGLIHGLEGRTVVFKTNNEDRMFGSLNYNGPKFGDYARVWTNVRWKCWDGFEGEGL